MNIAYVITAYKYPVQLARMINRIDAPGASFYVHIDTRMDITEFKKNMGKQSKIIWVKRVNSSWGTFGIVQATLNALKQISKKLHDIDYVINLTGQDYPIKSISYINSFLAKHKGKNFIEYFPMPAIQWKDGGMKRIEKYYFVLFGEKRVFPFEHTPETYKNRILEMILQICLPFPRKFPNGLRPFGGPGQWLLTSEAIAEILWFLEKRPDVIRFFRYCHASDEMLFQTVLLNISDMEKKIVNDDCRYVIWKGKASPEIITANHINEITDSPKLFARKFDMDVDQDILDMIDERILDTGK